MNYFIANISCHALVCILLIVLMVIITNRTFKRKTKHVLTYFMPVVLLILIGFDITHYLAPRMLDLNNVLSNITYTQTGRIEEISQFNNYFVVNGEKYFINPMRGEFEIGALVRVKYTPQSNYAMSLYYYGLDTED